MVALPGCLLPELRRILIPRPVVGQAVPVLIVARSKRSIAGTYTNRVGRHPFRGNESVLPGANPLRWPNERIRHKRASVVHSEQRYASLRRGFMRLSAGFLCGGFGWTAPLYSTPGSYAATTSRALGIASASPTAQRRSLEQIGESEEGLERKSLFTMPLIPLILHVHCF